jgi:tetratricopeptide (TPR) repeat protein
VGILDKNDALVASSLANLGNVETADENYEEARTLYQQAARIREEIGDSAATMLALTYLQIGRVDTLERKYQDGLKMLQRSESLFNRQTGSRLHYLAESVDLFGDHDELTLTDIDSSLYYAYGNREYLQSKYKEARRMYQKCVDYAEEKRPLHPLVCAAYYKLGSCEFELDDYEKARLGIPIDSHTVTSTYAQNRKLLIKALNIAEIRNPGGEGGTIARIWWKLAQVYKYMKVYAEQTAQMETRAYEIRSELTGVSVTDATWNTSNDREFEKLEHSYDVLVPTFFR